MAKTVKPIPEGYHSITASLTCRGAERAIEFYKKAFGAQELLRMPSPDGKISHAELKIGDSNQASHFLEIKLASGSGAFDDLFFFVELLRDFFL